MHVKTDMSHVSAAAITEFRKLALQQGGFNRFDIVRLIRPPTRTIRADALLRFIRNKDEEPFRDKRHGEFTRYCLRKKT